jgi:RimJ/RimL family protein N-acetyltransferase
VSGGLRLRRAEPADLDFLQTLTNDPAVDPFLSAGRARDAAELRVEIERSQREPQTFGRMIVELDGERAGAVGYEVVNRRSRIARLEALALGGAFRGRGLADEAARLLQRYLFFELGLHRLELEIYGFNERAIRHAERAGFVREGVKRKAYWRHGEWADGVVFGLVREDLDAAGSQPSEAEGRV